MRLLAEGGTHVDVLYMTRGERGSEAPEGMSIDDQQRLGQTRTREAEAACEVLGVREVLFLDAPDGSVQTHEPTLERLRSLLDKPYRRVFAPWAQDRHADHQATLHWLVRALQDRPTRPSLWLYEVWTPMPSGMTIPIDSTFAVKCAAIAKHESQMAMLNYANAFHGLAQYRSLSCPTSQYAEMFQVVDAS